MKDNFTGPSTGGINASEINEVSESLDKYQLLIICQQWSEGKIADDQFHFRELSGGILLDQGVHILDVCNWALQDTPINAITTGGRIKAPDFGIPGIIIRCFINIRMISM